MRQAIETRYFGPTNFRGSRVKATAQAGSVTLSWDDALSVDENHVAAARALASKYGWSGRYAGGALVNGRGYVFVTDDGDGFKLPRAQR